MSLYIVCVCVCAEYVYASLSLSLSLSLHNIRIYVYIYIYTHTHTYIHTHTHAFINTNTNAHIQLDGKKVLWEAHAQASEANLNDPNGEGATTFVYLKYNKPLGITCTFDPNDRSSMHAATKSLVPGVRACVRGFCVCVCVCVCTF